MTVSSRAAIAGGGVAIGLFALLFVRELMDDRLFAFRDVVNHHLPFGRIISAELRAGRIPFWNEWIVCGTPLAANPNHYAFYPGRLLDLMLSPGVAITVHLLGHWVAGGVLTAMLAAMLGVSPLGAAGAAAAFLLAGPSLSLLNFANLAPFLAWIPATAMALLAALRRPRGSAAVALGACLAVQVTFAEPVLLVVETLVLGCVVLLCRDATSRPSDARPLLVLGGALVLAVLWSAPMWLPLLDLAGGSARGSARADLGQALEPFALWQVPVPQLFGEYHTLEKRTWWGEPFHGGKGPFFLSLSFGVALMSLAAGGAAARGYRAVAVLTVVALGLLLALGPHGPFGELFRLEAGRWFRWPVKLTLVASFLLPILVGLGIDAVVRARRGALVAGAAVALAFGLVLATAGLAPSWIGAFGAPFAEALDTLGAAKDGDAIRADVGRRLLRGGAVGLAAATILLMAAFRDAEARGRSLFGVAALALLLFDLAPPQRAVNRGTPRRAIEAPSPLLATAREIAKAGYRTLFPTSHWEVRVQRAPGMPDEWWPRVVLDREIGNFYHAAGERVPTVLVNPDRLVSAGAVRRAEVYQLMNSAPRRALTQLLGVRATARIGSLALDAGTPPVRTSVGWPAAFEVDDDALPLAMRLDELPPSADGSPWGAAFVMRAREHVRGHRDPAGVQVDEHLPGRWRLRTESERAGFLALAVTRDAGWAARVDGRRTPILPYLEDFMAVPVDAGRHEVEWTYRPPRFGLGLALFALATVGVVAAATLGHRKSSSASRTAVEAGAPPT